MKTRTVIALVLAALSFTTSFANAADEPGFIPLFGKSATEGWAQSGPGGFTLTNGVATACVITTVGVTTNATSGTTSARKFIPVTSHFEGGHFFTRVGGRLHATPMFLVLLIVVLIMFVLARSFGSKSPKKSVAK